MGLTPDFRVRVAGEDLTSRIRPGLVSLVVTTTVDRESDEAEIAIADELDAVVLPRRGRIVEVEMGYVETGLVSLGRFVHDRSEIDAAPRQLRIRAAAADFTSSTASKAPRTRAWSDTTVGQIVSTIAAAHGLEAAVAPSLSAALVAHVDQTAESDLHFVRRLARRYDAIAKVVAGRLLFAASAPTTSARSRAPLPPVRLSRGAGVDEAVLAMLRLRASYGGRVAVRLRSGTLARRQHGCRAGGGRWHRLSAVRAALALSDPRRSGRCCRGASAAAAEADRGAVGDSGGRADGGWPGHPWTWTGGGSAWTARGL